MSTHAHVAQPPSAVFLLLKKLFWIIAAMIFVQLSVLAQTKEGTWTVKVVRSPMGDRSFAVASVDATETFNGERPRLIIACEVTRDGTAHGPLNVFVDLGAPLMLGDHFKDHNQPLPINTKIDDAARISDKWHQSDTFRELHHDANTEADQRAFVRWLADSRHVMFELSMSTSNKVFGFTTSGLKPYVPVMAQACGWNNRKEK